jgi:hypothetical protein
MAAPPRDRKSNTLSKSTASGAIGFKALRKQEMHEFEQRPSGR